MNHSTRKDLFKGHHSISVAMGQKNSMIPHYTMYIMIKKNLAATFHPSLVSFKKMWRSVPSFPLIRKTFSFQELVKPRSPHEATKRCQHKIKLDLILHRMIRYWDLDGQRRNDRTHECLDRISRISSRGFVCRRKQTSNVHTCRW